MRFLDNLLRKISGHTSSPSTPTVSQSVRYQMPPKTPPVRTPLMVPEKVDDCIQVYLFRRLKISPAPEAHHIALKMQEQDSWLLTVRITESTVNLYYEDMFFAKLDERCDMVLDWSRRGDPFLVYLNNFGDSGNFVTISFYRNEEERLSGRENDVVKLTRYSNQDAQLNLSGIESGAKLDLEEDYDREDAVSVLYGGEIGALPKKQAKRFLQEGCAGAFFHHSDYDDEKDKDIPYIKIYW